jgi:RNA polymerase sigma factor (sigma-70 family)
MTLNAAEDELARAVERAQAGDRRALEEVVRSIQDDVFHLAVRMLGDPDDARDASQEVLVRVVTKLGSFRGEARFRTWVYGVAVNCLLNFRKDLRRPESSFDELGPQLDAALAAAMSGPAPEPGDAVLLNEAKQVCTQGMLSCLDRPHRLAYILGEILDLAGEDAAAILDITPAAFRKRLSRARESMEAFVASRCGLANPDNACRCHKLLPAVVAGGLVDPQHPRLTKLPVREADRLRLDIERARTAAEIFRSLPTYAAPDDFASWMRTALATRDEPAH